MKTKLIASANIAMSLAASGSAFAQRGDRDHNDRNDRQEYGQQRDNDRHDNDRNNYQRGNSENHRNDYGQKFHRDDMRGGGPRHDLRRGQRLSPEYRDNRYVVNDWRARHLAPPPRGHHWVRAGNDYVLAAIATGVIAQVFLSN
ncbi:MAG: RcnB family protein [Massilia sp.]